MRGCILFEEKIYYRQENCVKACLTRKGKPASGVLDPYVLVVEEPIEPIYGKRALFL